VTTLPPSTNHLYVRTRGGGLALKKEAIQLREEIKATVVEMLGKVAKFPLDPELIYRFDLVLYFEQLENPGWFEFHKKDDPKGKYRAGERKAATRYKVIDVDNRVKFLQDSVSKSIGIPNDCQIFVGSQEKREDKTNPRAEVTITVVRDTSRFFPNRPQ